MNNIEGNVNTRAKDLILLRINKMEYEWACAQARAFCWNIDNLNERFYVMFARNENSASIASPVFKLSGCPKVCASMSAASSFARWPKCRQRSMRPGRISAGSSFSCGSRRRPVINHEREMAVLVTSCS